MKEKLSVFISLILRHKPEVVGIKLDKFGYANVEELLAGINKSGRCIDKDTLDKIVAEDNKQRYKYSADQTKIRASQGHSIKVDLELQESNPGKILYHGTAKRYLNSIDIEGLKKGTREYVHLSEDKQTAINVGKRHGYPVVLEIDTEEMTKDGYKFYLSENKVWLTENVPSKYIKLTENRGSKT